MLKKNIGIILLIFVIPLAQLPGLTVFATEDETIIPYPVTSSETHPSDRAITVSEDSENSLDFEASHFLYIPSVRVAFEEDDVSYMTEEEIAVLDLVNAEREQAGCGALEANPYLRTAAFLHSQDMAVNEYFDHTGLDGSRFWDRANRAGYQGAPAGENIAAGYRSAESVMNGWMNSSGHRANILNCRHTEIGIGYFYDSGSPYRSYWTQVFGRD